MLSLGVQGTIRSAAAGISERLEWSLHIRIHGAVGLSCEGHSALMLLLRNDSKRHLLSKRLPQCEGASLVNLAFCIIFSLSTLTSNH